MPSLHVTQAPDISLDHVQTSVINKFVKVDSNESRAIAWHKVGTGKTRLAYGWYLHLRDLGRANRCLIVIRPKAIYDWHNEASAIGFDRSGINFCSFGNLKSLNLRIKWDTIIIDELFLFGNPKSYRARRLAYVCAKASNVLGLSGTVLPKEDNTPIWGYSVVVGLSNCIARGITDFRTRYQTGFKKTFREQAVRLFRPKPGWEDELFSKLGNHVSFYFPKNYTRSVDRVTIVDATAEQRSLINKLVNLYVLDTKDGEIFCKTATEVYHRVRQILNGWISTPSGKLQLVECEKRAALYTKICELSESRERAIIWCAYRNDVALIRKELEVESLALVGGSKFDLVAWLDGSVRIVVATMGSGQSINYLNSARWSLFFSLSPKRLDWQQARGRVGRRGVDSTITNQFIRYSVHNSLDDKIYRAIQSTEDAEDTIIRQFQREYKINLPL
jgi:superfamily II DNA or RNA helicase